MMLTVAKTTAIALLVAVSMLTAAPPQQRGGGTDVSLPTLLVQGTVYIIARPGGNTTVQVGDEGILVVDTQVQSEAQTVVNTIRKLSPKPILWIVNTDALPEHVGGNEALFRL